MTQLVIDLPVSEAAALAISFTTTLMVVGVWRGEEVMWVEVATTGISSQAITTAALPSVTQHTLGQDLNSVTQSTKATVFVLRRNGCN